MSSSSVQALSRSQSTSLWTFHGHEKSTSRFLVVALGVIAMIGSLVANGILFSHLGYASFSIGGSGLLIGGTLIIGGFYAPSCSTQSNEAREESKTATVRLQEGKHYKVRRNDLRRAPGKKYCYRFLQYVEVSPTLYTLLQADPDKFGFSSCQFRDNFGGFAEIRCTGIFLKPNESEEKNIDDVAHILNELTIESQEGLALPRRLEEHLHYCTSYSDNSVLLHKRVACIGGYDISDTIPWSNQPAWKILESIAYISETERGYRITIKAIEDKETEEEPYRLSDIQRLLEHIELEETVVFTSFPEHLYVK